MRNGGENLLRRSNQIAQTHNISSCILKIMMHNENMHKSIVRANLPKGGDAKLPGFAG